MTGLKVTNWSIPGDFRAFSYLRWQETGRDEGISIPWQKVTLHAISSEPVKCIYVMLDTLVDYPPANGHGNGHDRMDEGNDNDDDEGNCEGMYGQHFGRQFVG